MTQPAQPTTPFPYGWFSFGLGRYRPCNSTYCHYPYAALPPIDEAQLDGTFGWLGPLDEQLDARMEIYRPAVGERIRLQTNLQNIVDEARELGLVMPPAFLRLMASTELQDRIPSCTACYFDLLDHIVPYPVDTDGYIIRFLNDQQSVLTWYLFAVPRSEPCVVVSYGWLDDTAETSGLDDEGRQTVLRNTFICAPTFEAFIYRFWLENTIWFNLHDANTLTPEQVRYLAHYRRLLHADEL
jgi:hypothetical protein